MTHLSAEQVCRSGHINNNISTPSHSAAAADLDQVTLLYDTNNATALGRGAPPILGDVAGRWNRPNEQGAPFKM